VIHYHKLLYLLAIFVVLGLAACDTPPAADPPTTSEADTAVIVTDEAEAADTGVAPPETSETEAERETAETAVSPPGMRLGMGRGPRSGMMARHHAPIPTEYAGLTNPVPADEASLERGADLYFTHCASCHGDGGMGDGPAGAALDPAPAPIARTGQRMGDDYFFWRTSEGGAADPFNSAMPAWENVLDEQARWDVINYIQALGSGRGPMRHGMGGAMFNPDAPNTQQADMLAAAIAAGVITETEAELFAEIHDALSTLMGTHGDHARGNMDAMEAELLAELVEKGTISEAAAHAFHDIHDRLLQFETGP
jgi:mono/diheme cytochrome c family protein